MMTSIKMISISMALLLVGLVSGCQSTRDKLDQYVNASVDFITPGMSSTKKELLINTLTDKNPDVRREGILQISTGKRAKWKITPELLSVVVENDPNPLVQTIAIERLVVVAPTQEVVILLGKMVKSPDESVQLAAVQGIGKITSEQSMALLQDQLTYGKSNLVKRHAAIGLSTYKTIPAVNTLIKAIHDDAFEVHYQVRMALKTISGEDYKYNKKAWQQWVNTHKNQLQ